jgi:hypothetical protein
VEKQKQHQQGFFWHKNIQKDVQRMSKECPEDLQRMSRGCPKGIQRGPKDLQRKDWGCIIMHTSA